VVTDDDQFGDLEGGGKVASMTLRAGGTGKTKMFRRVKKGKKKKKSEKKNQGEKQRGGKRSGAMSTGISTCREKRERMGEGGGSFGEVRGKAPEVNPDVWGGGKIISHQIGRVGRGGR